MSYSSRKRTDLIERIRYPNPLPLPPYPPKLLTIETSAERYADPAWSSRLADLVPFPLVVDGEGGMPLDINAFPELWATDAQGRPVDGAPPPLNPSQTHSEDAWLLNPALATTSAPLLVTPAYLLDQQATGRSGTATPTVQALGAKDVGWLRRTEYLGADRKAKAEAAIRSARQGDRAGMDVSPSAEASRIEATFAAAEVPLNKMQHPTKKDLQPMESFDLLPDFDTWATQFHILKFSDAPGRHEDARQLFDPRLNVSLLRARPDPFTMRPLVSFFLPTTIPADLSPEEFDEILLADPDAFDEEDRAFFLDQAGELDDSVREAAVLRREERRRRNGWAADLPQEPEEVEGEEEEATQEKMVAFARERAKLTTPYSHQRDYEPERQGGEEEWQRILVINFGKGQEVPASSSSPTLQPLVARERESIQGGYKEGGGQKAYYHPIAQRTTLRVKRSRRPDAHDPDQDYWQSIALTHQELSVRDQLKRLHKRAEIDLLEEPLPELEESEEEEEAEADEQEVAQTGDEVDEDGQRGADRADEDDSDGLPSRRGPVTSITAPPVTNGGRKRAGIASSDDEDMDESRTAAVSTAPPTTATPRSSSDSSEVGKASTPAPVSRNDGAASKVGHASPSSQNDSDGDSDQDEDEDDDDAESLDADEELAALAEEAGQTGGEGGAMEEEEGAGRGGRGSRRRAAAVAAAMDTADD